MGPAFSRKGLGFHLIGGGAALLAALAILLLGGIAGFFLGSQTAVDRFAGTSQDGPASAPLMMEPILVRESLRNWVHWRLDRARAEQAKSPGAVLAAHFELGINARLLEKWSEAERGNRADGITDSVNVRWLRETTAMRGCFDGSVGRDLFSLLVAFVLLETIARKLLEVEFDSEVRSIGGELSQHVGSILDLAESWYDLQVVNSGEYHRIEILQRLQDRLMHLSSHLEKCVSKLRENKRYESQMADMILVCRCIVSLRF